jgi:hypothetical protein
MYNTGKQQLKLQQTNTVRVFEKQLEAPIFNRDS